MCCLSLQCWWHYEREHGTTIIISQSWYRTWWRRATLGQSHQACRWKARATRRPPASPDTCLDTPSSSRRGSAPCALLWSRCPQCWAPPGGEGRRWPQRETSSSRTVAVQSYRGEDWALQVIPQLAASGGHWRGQSASLVRWSRQCRQVEDA